MEWNTTEVSQRVPQESWFQKPVGILRKWIEKWQLNSEAQRTLERMCREIFEAQNRNRQLYLRWTDLHRVAFEEAIMNQLARRLQGGMVESEWTSLQHRRYADNTSIEDQSAAIYNRIFKRLLSERESGEVQSPTVEHALRSHIRSTDSLENEGMQRVMEKLRESKLFTFQPLTNRNGSENSLWRELLETHSPWSETNKTVDRMEREVTQVQIPGEKKRAQGLKAVWDEFWTLQFLREADFSGESFLDDEPVVAASRVAKTPSLRFADRKRDVFRARVQNLLEERLDYRITIQIPSEEKDSPLKRRAVDSNH